MTTRTPHRRALSGTYPSAADAELQQLTTIYRSKGRHAAQLAANDALSQHRISCSDYVWLVRWTEGRVS